MDKAAIITRTIDREGGFVDNPNDPGGATKYGISLRWYRKIHPNATIKDIITLTREEAFDLYDRYFYTPNRVDDVPDYLREIYFDTGVNSGPQDAALMLQRTLAAKGIPITLDGVLGPVTIALLNQYKPELRRVAAFKLLDYADAIHENPVLMQDWYGWFNRTLSFI